MKKFLLLTLLLIVATTVISCNEQPNQKDELSIGVNYTGQVGVMSDGIMVAPITQPIQYIE